MGRRELICGSVITLFIVMMISCKSKDENKGSLLTGTWKLNTVRTELPQWMVKWDSTGFEPEISRQYFETLFFNDNGEVQVKRYRDVPDAGKGEYFYDKGKWVYDKEMEVLLLELSGNHRNEESAIHYKAEYQVDSISEDTLRITRIRVISKQGNFRDN